MVLMRPAWRRGKRSWEVKKWEDEKSGPSLLIGSPNREGLGPLRPTPALCGIPSGLDDLGADAPAQSGCHSMTDGISAYAGEFGGCKVKRDRGQGEGVVVGSADDFDKVFRVARGAGP